MEIDMNLLEMYSNGTKVQDIASFLGVTFKECQQLITKELVELYKDGMSIKGIARKTNKPKGTISIRISKHIVKRTSTGYKRLTEEAKQRIIQLYVVENKNLREITQDTGYLYPTVSKFVKKHGLKQSNNYQSLYVPSTFHLFQSDFLSCSESYILGFISGDGHISKHADIFFLNTDFDVIEKIKNYFPTYYLSKKETGYKPLYTLHKRDLYLASRMNYFGLDNRKSYSIRFPKHIQMNFSSYLRGLFDADGHISVFGDNKNKVQIGFTSGSKEFLEDLVEQMKNHLQEITRHTISLCKCRNSNTYQLKYSSKNALAVLKFMYSTKNNLYMQRKFDKYKLLVGSQPLKLK